MGEEATKNLGIPLEAFETGIADARTFNEAMRDLDEILTGLNTLFAHVPRHTVGGEDPFLPTSEVNFGKVKIGLTTERYTESVVTTDAAWVDLISIPLAEGEVIGIEVNVISRKTDGSERGVFHMEAVFYRNTSGNVTREGKATSIVTRRSTPFLKVGIEPDVGNQTVDVRVKGIAGANVKWEARIIVTSLSG